MKKCEHTWFHLGTYYRCVISGNTNIYTRYEEYYCEKCITKTIKKKTEDCDEVPYWYNP